MSLAAGTQVGPYVVVSLLGAGGMGEVYRARDTRLNRDVALKILPESTAGEGERLRRFEDETRAIAALSHPNILSVFDAGQYNGAPYFVSELLEGENLRVTLERGPLPPRKTVEYGVQIAQGLAAAHEKGIVHRDLKPENIFLTRDGRIKILDFGLARLAQKPATPDASTLTSMNVKTLPGVVLGTPSYMAPEQVRGQVPDSRTDIFTFGAVLYEMISGLRVFHRATTAETMTAVLKDDPPEFIAAARSVSPVLDRIIRRCLEKDPEQRFQSARDLSFALGALSLADGSGSSRAIQPAPTLPFWKWLPIALALCVVAAAAAWFFPHRAAPPKRIQFAIPVPGEASHMALSRDGSMLAFVAPDAASGIPVLYVQRIGAPNATLLSGTEGAAYPFWSPDAANLAFFANGKLERIAVSGGLPQVLAHVVFPRGGSWGRRDVILYAPFAGGSIWKVNADGTGAAPATGHINDKDDITHRWPMFLPDGNHFLFWAGNFGNEPNDHLSGIYIGSLDGRERRLVTLCHSSFGYDASSLYYADDEHHLISRTFNFTDGTLAAGRTQIAAVVRFQPSTYRSAFTVADNGTIVYDSSTGAALSALAWVDRSGRELARMPDAALIDNPTISPDGSRIVVDISDEKANNIDLWFINSSLSTRSRFTFNPEEEEAGVWSRDGTRLAYRAGVSYGTALFLKPASGLEREHRLLLSPLGDDFIPTSWSADDKQILCTLQTPTSTHLALVPAAGESFVQIAAGPGDQNNGQISPDGKWVAYASNESGNWEIYAMTFPGAAGRWQISRNGGTEPRWSGDGKEIFFLGPRGMVMAASVESRTAFSSSTPVPLFQSGGRAPISSTDVFSYDVARDAKKFVVNRYIRPDHPTPLTIILNTGRQ